MRRVRLWISMLLLIALFTGCSAGGGAVRIHVTETGAGDGTGSGWGNALPGESLKIRLEQAKEGEEFWVAGGSYSPGPEKTDSFVLKSGVVLYGGFAGGEASLEERDWSKHKTILSGQGKNFHVVFSEGADGSAVLDGFTITGGAANGRQPMERSGGGMLNVQSSPAISNCVFSGNTALEMGGGMINVSGSSPAVLNCTFASNKAMFGGGMANVAKSDPTVTNCVFTENILPAGAGGGMFNRSSSPAITGGTFSNNSAAAGGGMYSDEGSAPVVTDSTFSGNKGQVGGGMTNVKSSAVVERCTFSGNTGVGGGGMVNNSGSHSTVVNCTFFGNKATFGGGMIIGAGSPTIVNCTFFGNEADVGGAVANYASSPTVINCILWGNTAKSQIHNEDDKCLPVISFSVVQGGYAEGERIFTDDPLLSPLADNGGRVMTMALAENSPALYSGTPEGAPDTDARGIARPQGKGHDIGAYELESP